jgi:hypothetical protein
MTKHLQELTAALMTNDLVAERVFDHIPADMPAGYSTLIGRAYLKNDAAEVMRLIGELISKGLDYEAEKAELDEAEYMETHAAQIRQDEAHFVKFGVYA